MTDLEALAFCETCGQHPCTCQRCPDCGAKVPTIFEHIDVDCLGREPEEDGSYPPKCTNPEGHSWVEGPADRGDEGPIYCEYCGADGDA